MQKTTCQVCEHVFSNALENGQGNPVCPRCKTEIIVDQIKLEKESSTPLIDTMKKTSDEPAIYLWFRGFGWASILSGTVVIMKSISDQSWLAFFIGAGLIISGLFDFTLASFLARLDRAAHKLLAS